jgi:hypothetical protein
MRRSELRRKLLAAALLLHFLVLGLNALPGSRFVQSLYPYYGWYPRWTEQSQIWAMYQYPDRHSNEFEIVAVFDDGHEERPWGGPREMSSRETYFVEAMFYRDDQDRFAHRFLNVLWQRWPSEPKPRALLLRKTSVSINNFSEVPAKGIFGERQRREIERRW